MTVYVTQQTRARETQTRATLYHMGVDTHPPDKSDEREAKPKAADPKRDKPTTDQPPVDDKTPVTRFG